MGKVFELRGRIYSKYPSESACARQLGWPRQRLSKITNGCKEPDIVETVELAAVLGCSINEIISIFLGYRLPNEQLTGGENEQE